MTEDATSRYLLLVAALVLVAGSLLHAFGFHEWGVDDAYISYRFSHNLVDGHGLVFNPGERVEGYSNLLHVLLIALGLLIVPADSVYFVALFLNVVFISAALVLFHGQVRRLFSLKTANMAAFVFALCPLIWMQVASGLETALVVLIYVWIWRQVERIAESPHPRAVAGLAIAIVLSVLARADGFVMPVIAVVFLLFKAKWRAAFISGAVLAAAFGIYLACRYHYYGYPFPNTYYVKMSGTFPERFDYAFRQLAGVGVERGLLPYGAAFLAIGTRGVFQVVSRRRTFAQSLSGETFLALGWLCYWFWIGGDILGLRFLAILVPLGVAAVLRLLSPHLNRRGVLVFLAVVLVGSQSAYVVKHYRFWYSFQKRDGWIAVGLFLREHYPGKTIAVDAAGKIPYFSGLRTIDMLGLCDEHIAHLPAESFRWDRTKTDLKYVLSRKPDLIAAWMESPDNLGWGITRPIYEAAGYQLAWLATVDAPWEEKIVPAEGRTREEIAQSYALAYRYAILRKKDSE